MTKYLLLIIFTGFLQNILSQTYLLEGKFEPTERNGDYEERFIFHNDGTFFYIRYEDTYNEIGIGNYQSKKAN